MPTGSDTRARIIETALNALPDHGYGGLSVGLLAKQAGMSKSGLFARFGGQSALQCAIIEAAALRFRAHVIEPTSREPNAAARLKRLSETWLDWLTTDRLGRPCPVVQAAMEAPALTEEAGRSALQTRAEFAPYVARLAKRARLEGDFSKALDPDQFAFSFDGIGLAAGLYAMAGDPLPARERAEVAFDRLFAEAAA